MGGIRSIIAATLDGLVRFALPPRCPGCGVVTQHDHEFCHACWSKLVFLGDPQCARCGEPFEIDPGPGALCGACHVDPPAIDGMRAAVVYDPIARALAIKLKHGRRPGIARMMARNVARHMPADGDWLLVPVPLHRWRIWRRGFNQSALIARALADSNGHQTALGLLERRKATPMLRGLGPKGRADTVRGAFAVPRPELAKGRRIVLVDDVYTTGATANACARTLKRAGAAEVRLLCWARVARHDDVVR